MNSPDLDRIMALPRRPQPVGTEWLRTITEHMTRFLRKPDGSCKCAQLGRPCITKLFPVQAAALYEAPRTEGGLGLVGVGHGKTGLGILLPMVMPRCKTAVLLIPANLRAQFFEVDYPAWSQHFRVPTLAGGAPPWSAGVPVLHVLAYSSLSTARFTTYLENIGPDLIIADEAHNLRNRLSSRGGRVMRYLIDHPEVRFWCHSGTLTSRSVKDYAHLSTFALKERSPLPIDTDVVDEWAEALDPAPVPAPPGELAALGTPVRDAFRRRLVETVGVIATEESALGTSLEFERRDVSLPPEVKELITGVRSRDERPDGEILVDDFEKAKCLRELACGFYYRWRYPRGELVSVIERWFRARKAYMKEVRDELRFAAREHLDSPMLLGHAAERWHHGYTHEGTTYPPHCSSGPLPVWPSDCWAEWTEVEDTVHPETETVWVSTFLAEDAAEWAHEKPGIVWYDKRAFGEMVAQVGKFPRFGGGDEASATIIQETGKRSIVASMKAHGTGKNLQHAFSRNLIVPMPGDAGLSEQVVGRTHRTGQTADTVSVAYYAHTREIADAVERARSGARYIEETTGTKQKICYGAWL